MHRVRKIFKPLGRHLAPLRIALQFLTCLPFVSGRAPGPQQIGASLSWYPLVGALIGVVLCWFAPLLQTGFGDLLAAALLLTLWVAMTGALHLDGLADCADAWMGGMGSGERTLLLMKEPTSGPIAIVSVLLVLLVKFAAVQQLLHLSAYGLLLWPPILSRTAAMLLFATTPYVRAQGLGRAMSDHLSQRSIWRVTAGLLLIGLYFSVWFSSLLILVCLIVFLLLRRYMLRRIGGCTGDTTGALVELIEVTVLLAMLAWLNN